MLIKKIDIHAHTAWEVLYRSERTDDGWDYPISVPQLREKYDRMGIEKCVSLPLVSPEGVGDQHTNLSARLCCRDYPETVGWWFCNVDPRMLENSPDTDFTPMLEAFKALGAKGIGELTANLPVNDPKMRNLFRQAEQAELPILFHIGNPDLDYGIVDGPGLYGIERILQDFPRLILIGHSQKWWAEISGDCSEAVRNGYPEGKVTPGGRVVEIMRRYPNMYCDLSAGSGENAMRRDPEFAYRFLEEFQDRLLFGTDLCTPTDEINLSEFLDEAVENGKISQTAYNKICRENALRLLGETEPATEEKGRIEP